jgi:superfamily II DNA or RNA helicase
MTDIQTQYDLLLKQCESIRKENEELKSLLRRHGIAFQQEKADEAADQVYSSVTFPNVKLSLDERVSLFQTLFKGREDVFARRWYSSTTGKCGYQPVCVNEWRSGICNKKKYRCADCPNRSFAPLTPKDVYRHLEGKDENGCDVLGLYAIMPDNNCLFLCTDFDDKTCGHGYQDDVLAFVNVCKNWQIPYAIERSRSGNGAHVWIFFDTPLPAYKARQLGNAILTEAMKHSGRMSFKSYDRFFPNQDRLPEGGLGNLVALPLQGQARKKLNSVFVDDYFRVYRDQWAFLYHIIKIDESSIDQLLGLHQQEDLGPLTTSTEIQPWVTPIPQDITNSDFKQKVEIIKADKLYIPINLLSAKVLNHLKRIAAFKNPEFYHKQAMRLSTYSVPRIITCFEITDQYLAMPRGCEDALLSFFANYHVEYCIDDKTNHGNTIAVTFLGEERAEQLKAIEAMLLHNNGVLHATTAFGKTVTAASIIGRKKVNTLILVHTKALLTQWQERLMEFLKIEYIEPIEPQKRGRKKVFSPIGCFDSSQNTLHGNIDIAPIQSCISENGIKPFVQDYGMVIVDECHHISSVTFEQVLKSITAHTVYGLTATPIRKDGHQPIIFMQCGPIRYSADAKSQLARQTFDRYLIPRFTSYRSFPSEKPSISTIYQSLSEDKVRNDLIVEDIFLAISQGRTPIILTNRTTHVTALAEKLKQSIPNVISLTGTGTPKEKREALQHLHTILPNEPLVIVATGKYVGEGFDYPRLDTLFLALPISWKGLVAQYAGRLHRESSGKKDVRIYDYIDIHEPVCASMYNKRLKGYAAIGYRTIDKIQPTLFDNITDIKLSVPDNLIFNGKTFLRPYSADLLKAKRSIVIASPKLYNTKHNPLIELLAEQNHKGIEILVLTTVIDEQVGYIRSKGMTVYVNTLLSHCTTIIDK